MNWKKTLFNFKKSRILNFFAYKNQLQLLLGIEQA